MKISINAILAVKDLPKLGGVPFLSAVMPTREYEGTAWLPARLTLAFSKLPGPLVFSGIISAVDQNGSYLDGCLCQVGWREPDHSAGEGIRQIVCRRVGAQIRPQIEVVRISQPPTGEVKTSYYGGPILVVSKYTEAVRVRGFLTTEFPRTGEIVEDMSRQLSQWQSAVGTPVVNEVYPYSNFANADSDLGVPSSSLAEVTLGPETYDDDLSFSAIVASEVAGKALIDYQVDPDNSDHIIIPRGERAAGTLAVKSLVVQPTVVRGKSVAVDGWKYDFERLGNSFEAISISFDSFVGTIEGGESGLTIEDWDNTI
jgi:hypothetical protein